MYSPVVGLIARQTRAMNARLLASTDANNLTITSIAHRVALRVFQCDGRDDQIAHGLLRQSFRIGHDVAEEIAIDVCIVALLLQGEAEQGFALDRVRLVVGIDLSGECEIE